MDGLDLIPADDLSAGPTDARPKNGVVIALLTGAAIIFSYLFAYCLINALVAAEVMSRWQPKHDPRPKFFLGAFVTLLASFSAIAFLARTLSRRHLSRIDAMEAD